MVIDIGASSQKSFEIYKKHLKPTFAFYFDPAKKSADLFKSKVTPSAYVIKNNEIIYQSAVIDPGKDPSPNYLLEAMDYLKKNAAAPAKTAFGCFILRDED